MYLCDYKYLFGEEGKGLHSIRLFDIAVIDVMLTVVAATVIANVTKTPIWLAVVILFGLGIILHRVFCVNTTVNKWIFGVV